MEVDPQESFDVEASQVGTVGTGCQFCGRPVRRERRPVVFSIHRTCPEDEPDDLKDLGHQWDSLCVPAGDIFQ